MTTNQSWHDWAVAVEKHAHEHYNEDGWDFLVECYGRAEIIEALCDGFLDGRPVTNESEAIACLGERCALWQERRAAIESEIF